MTRLLTRAAPAAVALFGTAAAAQQVPNARPLGPVTATIAEAFGGVQSLRHLPDGRVLINDPAKRRVILFDSTLTKYTVVADSTSATANAYSGRTAGLIPFRGDSTLFVDPQSMSMLVIDPQGKLLERVMSVPRPDDAFALTGIAFGVPGFDAKGRLVYRAMPRFEFRGARGAPGANGAPTPPQMPDSAPIIRVELATRTVDTVTFLKTYAPKMSVTQREGGGFSMSSVLNPLPTVDDWAVLANGTVAVLRGRDFHVDLFDADGKVTSAPKVAHDWQRMSDEEKVAFLDSTKTAMEKARAEMQARIAANGGNIERAMVSAGGGPAMGGGGAPMIRVEVNGGPGGPGGGEPPRRNVQTNTTAGVTLPALNFIEPSELPDYKPPFAAGGARGDADGNVWVRLIATKPMPGPVYDIIDAQGKLVDRVVLPANSAIAGFGPGVVYLATREQDGTHLRRAKIR